MWGFLWFLFCFVLIQPGSAIEWFSGSPLLQSCVTLERICHLNYYMNRTVLVVFYHLFTPEETFLVLILETRSIKVQRSGTCPKSKLTG